jgi:hypothetical protein
MRQHALVVAQARIDASPAAAPRIDGEVRREGERPLIEPLGAQRFFAKWLMASPYVGSPGVEKQATLQSKILASLDRTKLRSRASPASGGA